MVSWVEFEAGIREIAKAGQRELITHMEKVRLQELLEDGTEEAWEGAFPL